jgi:quercetin dioxygenase-like cupin family protein
MRYHPANVLLSPLAWFWRTAARNLLFASRPFTLCFIALGLTTIPSLNARAQEAVALAHGNVPGEPHHHLKIENEYVRVYYVEVPPHEDTQLHQHDHDYIYVSLGPSDVVNAILNKPEIHLQLEDGETHFTRGSFAHVARNLADTPFRNITIELLEPQVGARNVCSPVILGVGFAACDPAPGSWWAMTEFETRGLKLDYVVLSPNGKYKEKISDLAVLVVGLAGSDIKISAKGISPKTLHEGGIEWFDAGSKVRFSSMGTKPAEFLKFTFKRTRQLKK